MTDDQQSGDQQNADGAQNAGDRQTIADALRTVQTYLDGLYAGDVDLLGEAFHEKARLFSATEDELVALDVPAYLAIVAGRPSPRSRGDARVDEIVEVSPAGPSTVHVRVRNRYLPKQFTDDLVIVEDRGRWQIISKVWHYDLI